MYKVEIYYDKLFDKMRYVVYKKVLFLWWPLIDKKRPKPFYKYGLQGSDDFSKIETFKYLTDFRNFNGKPMWYWIAHREDPNSIKSKTFKNLSDVKKEFAEYLI